MLKHSFSIREQYFNGRESDSFSILLQYGEKRRLDERQLSLMGEKSEKAASVCNSTVKNTNMNKGSSNKGNKKRKFEENH